MEFRIADPFTESLSKLTGQKQKLVKTTAFDLQLGPANPGMRFHMIGIMFIAIFENLMLAPKQPVR